MTSEPRDVGDSGDVPEGLEGYPYASERAERRIKAFATTLSVVAVGMLLVGLYLALFTTSVALGGVLALVGFVDLMLVPFVAKRMRAQAIRREGPGV